MDGNKRTAWVATRVFHSAEALVLAAARGESDVPEIAKSFALWSAT